MFKYKITVQYEGTDFYGFQKQKGKRTVEGELIKAIESFLEQKIFLESCGRCDRGVHALKHVCSFSCGKKLKCDRVPYLLNHKLPDDISIVSCEEVNQDFHARFSAKSRTYEFYFFVDKIKRPLKERYALRIFNELDIKKMNEAAKMISGRHDFSCFTPVEGRKEDCVREIFVSEVLSDKTECYYSRNKCMGAFQSPPEKDISLTENKSYKYIISANGFLRSMVRSIMGTLFLVGEGKIPPEHIMEIIKSKDRKKAGKTVAAKGLFLTDVEY